MDTRYELSSGVLGILDNSRLLSASQHQANSTSSGPKTTWAVRKGYHSPVNQMGGGRDKGKEEGASEGGWVGVLLRERERGFRCQRKGQRTPATTEAQGSCACVVHACIRSNGDVGALVWAGLCAECVCGQHAIPIHREQRCLHEEHRRTAAEVKLSLDRTQRHACTYTHRSG